VNEMDKEQSMVEHIELLSVVKDQLNEIPADLLCTICFHAIFETNH
jgi:hypothetical protein